MKEMKKIACLALGLTLAVPAFAQEKEEDRVKEAGEVLKEVLQAPDKGIPHDLLNKAECVVVYPSVKKAAFVVGGSYGRGVMTCRTGASFRGPWSVPTMMALEGGSFGLQLGAEATDFILLIMNEKGAKSVLSSKVKLGGDASAAAGPVGRTATAETDIVMKAEILSWSRARGLFAGVSLEGSTVRPDNGANKNIYGKEISAEDIVFKHAVKAPPSASTLLAELRRVSPHHKA
ncbi:lipid-binding SYLF domain-containing protein [Edaphobacter aggregans]|uniref:lipid-binding SYLF domain-containing protein n=1 Tax=Edaphobacter aggregans TaxID=570835 RepID=UPI000B2A0020|nr:lipid-binding SYLF domain-containing protein [Edaphobacter aggregans]